MPCIPIFGLPAEMPTLNVGDDMGGKHVLAQVGLGVMDVLHIALNAPMPIAVHGAGVCHLPNLGIVVADDCLRRRNHLAHVIPLEVLGETGDFLLGQFHSGYSL